MSNHSDYTKGYQYKQGPLKKRYNITRAFVQKHLPADSSILDLGPCNPLSKKLREDYALVSNSGFVDLDYDFATLETEVSAVTAFEILEHLVSPFPLLQSIKAPKLIASVPLQLWFAKAYWNEAEEWDRHYHEFEPRQFDMLLNKAGWEIKDSVKWKAYDKTLGIRPLLRRFTDRYYLVYCERK